MEPHFRPEEAVFGYANELPDCSNEHRKDSRTSPSFSVPQNYQASQPDVSSSSLIHNRRKPDLLQPVARESCDINSLSEVDHNDDLISLIRQLESERYDLLVSETAYQNRSKDTHKSATSISENGPSCRLSPSASSFSTTPIASRDPSGGEKSKSQRSKRSEKSSTRRLNRICQIDKEIKQLSQLLEMQEREKHRASTRTVSGISANASQSAAQKTHPAHHDLALHNLVDVRSSAAQKVSIMSISRPVLFLNKQDQLLSTLSSLFEVDKHRMTQILLDHCSSSDQCFSLYQQNIFPVVLRLIHDPSCGISESPRDVRIKAGQVLNLLVGCQPEGKRGRRERAVLEWLQTIRTYNDLLINSDHDVYTNAHWESAKLELWSSLMSLRRYSSDDENRHCICFLGGLSAVAELLQCDFQKFDNRADESHSDIRVCACMILTNLSYGDGVNKALLCSSQSFLECLTHLLQASSEELRLNASAVIRNISWRADVASKHALREAKMIVPLLSAAMETKSETAQKVFLSALANLSAHNDENRQAICAFDGGLAFLINRLSYKSPSDNISVVEFAGGTLRSVSCVIALRSEYRQVLREKNCLKILVDHLKSSCLAWITNACAILWNLSARCVEDQQQLFDLGALPLLEHLTKSKVEAIATSSAKAVRNLHNARTMGLIASSSSRGAARAHTANVPSRRARNSRRPMGNHEAQIHSADSIQTDEFGSDDTSPERLISMSVPASPLVSNRFAKPDLIAKVNGPTEQNNGGFFTASHQPRSTHLMTAITHQVANGSNENIQRSFVNRCLSPPVSATNTGATLRLRSEHSQLSQTQSTNGWVIPPLNAPQYSSSSVFSQYVEPPPEDLWPKTNSNPMTSSYLYSNTLAGELEDDSKKNFFVAPEGDDFDPENQDTIKQYNTEGTPQFSTNVSTCDLRSVMQEKPLYPFLKPREPINHPAEMAPTVRAASIVPKHVSSSNMQITSMMVSRSSTPSGMSEVDLVFNDDITEKQSLYSEFSRRQSEAVSPSDIPASPSLMRPSSKNKRRILPAPPVEPKDSPPPRPLPLTTNKSEHQEVKVELTVEENSSKQPSVEVAESSELVTGEKKGELATECQAEEDDMLSKMIDMGMKNSSNTGSWKRSSKSKKLSIAPSILKTVNKTLTTGTSELAQDNSSNPFGVNQAPASVAESSPSKESPNHDTVKVFSNEGLSSSTSMNSLVFSAITMDDSRPKWGFDITPSNSSPHVAKNKSLVKTGTENEHHEYFSLAPSEQLEPMRTTNEPAADGFRGTSDNQPEHLNTEKPVPSEQQQILLETQVPSETSFKWPQPPSSHHQVPLLRGPAIPPRTSSVSSSLQSTPTNPPTNTSIASEEAIQSVDRTDISTVFDFTQNESLGILDKERTSESPPPVPPPLVSYKEVFEDSACVVQDFDDDVADLLTDCIYSVLPIHATSSKGRDHKSAGSGRKSGSRSSKPTDSDTSNAPSERKMRIQYSVMSRGKSDKLMNGHAVSTEQTERERSSPQHPPRSQSFDISAINNTKNGGLLKPTSREKLRLPLTLPNCETEIQHQVNNRPTESSNNMTGIWVEQSGKYYEGAQNGVEVPKNSKDGSSGYMDFDQMSLIESGLASRFSASEISGDDDIPQSSRAPRKYARIVKPATRPEPRSLTEGLNKVEKPVKKVRGRGGHRSHSANHMDFPQPIISVYATGMHSPKREVEPDFSAIAARHRTTVEAEISTVPSRLMKQGTFTKDRSLGMAIPWIVPENDITAQAAIRKRNASTTRGENITAFSREGPRSRSARSTSNMVRSVSGHNIADMVNGLSLQLPEATACPSKSTKSSSSSSKSPVKKSQPVTSKIASLWRKNESDSKKKEEKKVEKKSDTVISSAESTDRKSNGVKSPALSERFRSSTRGLPAFLSQRKSATLPKKLKNGTAGLSPVKLTSYEDRKSNGNGSVHPTTSV